MVDIDVNHAKTVARAWAWEVFEATDVKYFGNKKWLSKVVRAEHIPERDQIHFTLKDGGWTRVERKLS